MMAAALSKRYWQCSRKGQEQTADGAKGDAVGLARASPPATLRQRDHRRVNDAVIGYASGHANGNAIGNAACNAAAVTVSAGAAAATRGGTESPAPGKKEAAMRKAG